jgi:hypothetical protein
MILGRRGHFHRPCRGLLPYVKETGGLRHRLISDGPSGPFTAIHVFRNTSRRASASSKRESSTRNCRKLGITIHGTFILGLPDETPDTIQKTVEFAIRCGGEKVLNYRYAVPCGGEFPPKNESYLMSSPQVRSCALAC